jgi:hypothetical protein
VAMHQLVSRPPALCMPSVVSHVHDMSVVPPLSTASAIAHLKAHRDQAHRVILHPGPISIFKRLRDLAVATKRIIFFAGQGHKIDLVSDSDALTSCHGLGRDTPQLQQ